jgi:hypothetical protein
VASSGAMAASFVFMASELKKWLCFIVKDMFKMSKTRREKDGGGRFLYTGWTMALLSPRRAFLSFRIGHLEVDEPNHLATRKTNVKEIQHRYSVPEKFEHFQTWKSRISCSR